MNPAEEQPVLLRVVVGSRAHGLSREDSDYDYREVFAYPTSTILSLGRPALKHAWMTPPQRMVDDEGGYEIAEFLHLVAKGAPGAVEMLFAPKADGWHPATLLAAGERSVQAIGRTLLTRKAVQDGILGYASNAMKKIPERPGKWKGTVLRVLYQGQELLRTGGLPTLEVPEYVYSEPLTWWGAVVRSATANKMTDGIVLDRANALIAEIKAMPSALPDVPDWSTANAWLLRLRREMW